MWRCLVEENVTVGQVSNVGCGSEHRPMEQIIDIN